MDNESNNVADATKQAGTIERRCDTCKYALIVYQDEGDGVFCEWTRHGIDKLPRSHYCKSWEAK